MPKYLFQLIYFFLTLTVSYFFAATPLLAGTSSSLGFGDLAQGLMEPVQVLDNFLVSAAIIVGITCLFAAFVRYMQYRVNPLANPLSTVIILFILSLILLLLPFIYKYTESGIPTTLF